MCSTGPFQYRWLKGYIYSSCYYHHQIGCIQLSHCYHIFSMVVCLRCLLHRIMSLIAYTFRENREFVFIIIVQFLMSANSRIRFCLQIVLVCLYSTPSNYHHCANLSGDIELIKCQSDIFCRVCKIKNILSVIHYTICRAVCFSLPISLLMIEIIYILCRIIIIKSEIRTITHCLGLGHETMKCFALYNFRFFSWLANINKWQYLKMVFVKDRFFVEMTRCT